MEPEAELLRDFLDQQRNHVLGILEGLTDEQLRRPVLPSGWNCLGMVRHLALADEHYWFRCVVGLAAIERMWDEEREGPDEVFTLATDILAVDGATAVVRAEVHYGDPPHQEYRDLWVIHLGDDGRCTWFEEWPFWPEHPYAARDAHT